MGEILYCLVLLHVVLICFASYCFVSFVSFPHTTRRRVDVGCIRLVCAERTRARVLREVITRPDGESCRASRVVSASRSRAACALSVSPSSQARDAGTSRPRPCPLGRVRVSALAASRCATRMRRAATGGPNRSVTVAPCRRRASRGSHSARDATNLVDPCARACRAPPPLECV